MLSDEEQAIDADDWRAPWSVALRDGWPLGVVEACTRSLNAPNPLRRMIACSPPDYFGLSGAPGSLIVFMPDEDPRVQNLRDACDDPA